MSNARIIEIPATRQIRSGKNNTMRKMRVAAYCRVSTEEEEQQGSFETQKLYYTEKSTQPQNGNWPGFMPTTVSPASIQKSVTDLTR